MFLERFHLFASGYHLHTDNVFENDLQYKF